MTQQGDSPAKSPADSVGAATKNGRASASEPNDGISNIVGNLPTNAFQTHESQLYSVTTSNLFRETNGSLLIDPRTSDQSSLVIPPTQIASTSNVVTDTVFEPEGDSGVFAIAFDVNSQLTTLPLFNALEIFDGTTQQFVDAQISSPSVQTNRLQETSPEKLPAREETQVDIVFDKLIETIEAPPEQTNISLAEGNKTLVWGAATGTASIQGGFNQYQSISSNASLTVDYSWAPGAVNISAEQGYGIVFDAEGEQILGFDAYDSGWSGFIGGDHDDTLEGSGSSPNMLAGGSGNDLIISRGNSNFLSAGDGSDIVFVAINDSVELGSGDDVVVIATESIDVNLPDFTLTDDTLLVNTSANAVSSAQTQEIVASSEKLSIYGATDDPQLDAIDGIFGIWESVTGVMTITNGEEKLTAHLPGLIGNTAEELLQVDAFKVHYE